MKTAYKSYSSTAAVTTVDLKDLAEGADGDVFSIADFDIEVVGNDAAVTIEVVGPFPTSSEFAPTDNSFAIGGGKKSIENFAIGSIVFTRVGTTAYTINIVRRIKDQ